MRVPTSAAGVLGCLLVLSGCSAATEPVPTVTVPAVIEPSRAHPPAPDPWSVSAAERAALPVADPWGVLPQAVPDPDPGTMPSGLLVTPRAEAGTPLYDAPQGKLFAVLPLVQYRGATSYPVIAQSDSWYQILLTVRRGLPSQVGPTGVNDATGWVHADDVTTSTTDYRITVSLSNREVTLLRGDQVLARTETGIGMPATPTPVTRTFVMSIYPDPQATYSRVLVAFGAHSPTLDSFSVTRTFVMSIYPDPQATYSRVLVAFGAHSPTLDSFSGGPAPIAIHAYPSHRGAISNGCLRIPAAMLDAFAAVPLGTPVLITP